MMSSSPSAPKAIAWPRAIYAGVGDFRIAWQSSQTLTPRRPETLEAGRDAKRAKKKRNQQASNPLPTPAAHPSFVPQAKIVCCVRRAFDDLEESLGRYSSRTGDRFLGFLQRRPEYPCVLSRLPFLAVEQLLFAVSHHRWADIFESTSGGAVRLRDGPFSLLLEHVAAKYRSRAPDFMQLAHHVLAKVAVQQTAFVAAYVGPEGRAGDMPCGPREPAPSFRQQRIFEWRWKGQLTPAHTCHIFSVLPLGRTRKHRRGPGSAIPAVVDCDPFRRKEITPDDLARRVSATVCNEQFGAAVAERFCRSTGNTVSRGVVRLYLLGEPQIPFVSMLVDQEEIDRLPDDARPIGVPRKASLAIAEPPPQPRRSRYTRRGRAAAARRAGGTGIPATLPAPLPALDSPAEVKKQVAVKHYQMELLPGFPWTNVEFQ